MKSVIEEAQLSQRNWMELRGGVTLSALKALATQMGGLRDGRKSILFFSQGPGVRPGSLNDELMREIDEAASRGNVTIHVIDPRPLGSVGFGGDTVLRRLAADTGGRAIVNTNNPTEQLAGVMADASAYYLVGYTPTRRTNDGKFHEIKVRVKRRGVRVTARRGYWAASEKEMTAAAEAAATPVNIGADHGVVVAVGFGEHPRGVDLDGFCQGRCEAHARHVHVGAESAAAAAEAGEPRDSTGGRGRQGDDAGAGDRRRAGRVAADGAV